MIWLVAILLAAAAFVALLFLMKPPRKGWDIIGAALLLGIAGYGLQASPAQPGAPKTAVEVVSDDPAALVDSRRSLGGKDAPLGSNWVVIADGLARHGQYANAAGILKGAIKEDPGNGEAWLALANALVAHADGTLSPASLFAFRHAAEVGPGNPGPPFFLGLALAQSGRLAEGRALWARLLEDSPPDAPWRADLELRLGRLDEFIAQQRAMPQVR